MSIKVVTNNKGSGDWIVVQGNFGSTLFSGHRVTPQDLVNLLTVCSDFEVELVEVNDEEMEELC
jgi:hypothetical protein